MTSKTFREFNCDLKELRESLEAYLIGREFKVQNFYKQGIYLTQAKKENTLFKDCIFIKIEGVPQKFQVTIGKGTCLRDIRQLRTHSELKLTDNLLLGELRFEPDLWTFIETKAELKRNTAELQRRTIPSPPYQIMKEITREIEVIYCQHCGTKNNARLVKCQHCNASLH